MRFLICLSIIFTCFFEQVSIAGEKVGFFHGIKSSGGTWTSSSYNMIANLQQSYYMIPKNPSRRDYVSFYYQAQDIHTSLDSKGYIAVCHSMGAPATRTYIKNYGNNANVKSIITVTGANSTSYVARSLYYPSPGYSYWTWFLQRQEVAILGPIAAAIGSFLSEDVVDIITELNDLALVVMPLAFASSDAMRDLAGYGTGYSNIQTESNFPKVGIIGMDEDVDHLFYRTAASFGGYSRSDGADFQDNLTFAYNALAWYMDFWGYYYGEPFLEDGSPNFDYDPILAQTYYYYRDVLFTSVDLLDLSAEDWKRITAIIFQGSNNQWYEAPSDGVLPYFTQEYINAQSSGGNIEIQGSTNHKLATKSENSKNAIAQAFFLVNYNNTPFLHGVSISPTAAQTPAGYGPYTFTANVNGGSGSFTYDWYYLYPETDTDRLTINLVPGTGGWKYKNSGPTTSFQPVHLNSLKVVVKDNLTLEVKEAMISW